MNSSLVVTTLPSLLVVGYYGRGNLGDESYITLMPAFFPSYQLDFISSDDLASVDGSKYEGVIVGGGDIINAYFNSKISAFLDSFHGPRIAFSVGVPFESLINHEYFDHFDRVYVRNREDVSSIQTVLGNDRVNFTPDIGFALKGSERSEAKRENKVGVFLVGNIMRFPKVVAALSEVVARAAKDSEVVLYCFNPREDLEISEAVAEQARCLSGSTGVISVDSGTYDNTEMINLISTLKLSICMRYHAHVFSVASDTPILSISATRKTRSLMKTGKLTNYQYEVPLDGYCTPTDEFNLEEVLSIYEVMTSDLPKVAEEVSKYNEVNRFLLKTTSQEDFFTSCRPIANRLQMLLEKKDVPNAARLLAFEVAGQPDTKFNYGLIEKLLRVDLGSLASIQEVVSDFVDYFGGLSTIQNVLKVGVMSALNIKERSLVESKLFIDLNEYASYNGVHRGGWYLACEKLASFNRFNEIDLPEGILCDMYVDRTFHWAKNYMKISGKVPYTAPWCGFIHHTTDKTHDNNYNVDALFLNEDFLISLHMCRGLFTLTESLKDIIEEKLASLGMGDVKVTSFTHPIDTPSVTFSMRRFQESVPKIVNIGAWMRNPFSIYRAALSPKFYHVKYALKGKDMEQYFPPSDLKFEVGIAEVTNEEKIELSHVTPCRPCRPEEGAATIWVRSLLDWLASQGVKASFSDSTLFFELEADLLKYEVIIKKMITSVTVIEHLSNDLYDQMLADFVVFLDLFDAAAVNTVLECIVRNTPIIINKLPGTVDLLGADYPLFYETEDDLKEIGYQQILAAHNYLKALDKKQYGIDYFVKDVLSAV